MTPKPVQAVFFWRATGTSVFKAVYGRRPKDPVRRTYTKDFHQPRNKLARALEQALGVPEGGDTAVEWRWPGGTYPGGRLKPARDFDESGGRLNLRWQTDSAPPPWRLTEHPTETTLSTMQGTPDLDTEVAANAQLDALKLSGENPWLIAVHLYGDGPVLHARVVLENPQPEREFASWDTLPASVRTAMRNLGANEPGGYATFAEGTVVPDNDLVTRILEAFRDNPNVLLVGPPGTGKTVAMDAVRLMYAPNASGETVTFDPDLLHRAFDTESRDTDVESRVQSLVFHPSYAYEHFVMGLLPDVDGDKMFVRPQTGPLLDLAYFASQPNHRALLILDEFNRGAAAAIFGDMLALLDKDKRSEPGDDESGAKIATPYAHLQPKTTDGQKLKSETSLPSTLHILAAMNSADRSVAPLDAALRRRFAIVHVDPDLAVLTDHLGADDEDFDPRDETTWTSPAHIAALAVAILAALNERIEMILGRDFLLGQSVMWDVSGDDVETAMRSLASALDNRVMGTLALTFTDNDEAFAATLHVTDQTSGDRAAKWVPVPASLAGVGMRRLRPTRLADLDSPALTAVLKSLL